MFAGIATVTLLADTLEWADIVHAYCILSACIDSMFALVDIYHIDHNKIDCWGLIKNTKRGNEKKQKNLPVQPAERWALPVYPGLHSHE